MRKFIFAAYAVAVLIFLFNAERSTLRLLNPSGEFTGLASPVQAAPVTYELSPLSERSAHSTYLADFSRRGRYSAHEASGGTVNSKWRIADLNNKLFPNLINAPAADESGFYVPDDSGYLRAYSWAGELRWQFYSDLDRGFMSAPLTDEDTVYIGDSSGYFYAISKGTGKIRWLLKVGKSVRASPVLFQNILYLSVQSDADSSFLVAVDARSGAWIWHSDKVKGEISAPSLSEKLKFIFLTSSEGELKAFNLQGKEVWTYKTHSPMECAPLVSGGSVVVTSKQGKVFSVLAASSVAVWKADLNTVVGCPSLSSKGVALIGSGSHYFLDEVSGAVTSQVGGMTSTPAVIGAGNGEIMLFQCENRSLCVEQIPSGSLAQRIQLRSKMTGNPVYFNGHIIVATEEIDGLIVFER